MGTPNQGGTKTQQIADYVRGRASCQCNSDVLSLSHLQRTATSSVFVMKTPENVVLTYTFLSPITVRLSTLDDLPRG